VAAASALCALLGLGGAVAAALALLAAALAAAALPALAAASARELKAAAEAAGAGRAAEERAAAGEAAARAAEAEAAALGRRLSAELAAAEEAGRASGSSALRRLRFADSILAKVPVKTEEAAFALMDRLVHLRDQSAKAAEAALDAERGSTSAEAVESLAKGARITMTSVRAALWDMRKHDKDAATGLKGLGEELKSGIELLTGIEEITERSRLIAFNMAIEAARIGEKGRGFRVIVGELRALNDRTVEFSKRVVELLDRFRKFNENLVETAITSSVQVAEEVERGIAEEEEAIESLLRASTSCVDMTDSVNQAVRSMNLELDGVLESLQFQDITRQMVEGALLTIAEAEKDIAPLAGRGDSVRGGEEERRKTEELRRALLARAKTKGEKEAIQEVK
jgi:methyl-accepting chemotaxis protein